MEAEAALAARKTLGLSQDALAADLNLTPSAVAAWETGEIRLPKRIEEQLRWRVAVTERIAALADSGLPECEWQKTWETRHTPTSMKALTKFFEEDIAHRKTCQICAARDKYIQDRFGSMPPAPTEGWTKALGVVAGRIERLPRWAQPAAWTAAAFGAYSLLRIVVTLPTFFRNPRYWTVSVEGLALSVSIGAAIGLIYGGFRELRERYFARRAI